MRKTKRWLAFLLSLSMVLSVGTSPVLAASADDPAQTAVEASAQAVPDAETEEQTEASKEETGEEETKAEGTKTEETKAEERKSEEAAGKAAEPAAGAAKDKGTDAEAEPQEPENKSALPAQEKLTACYLVSRPMTRLVYPRILTRTERRLFTGRLPAPTSGRERESLLRQAA